MDSKTETISEFMENLFQKYSEYLIKTADETLRPFWDIVVLTASDEGQKLIFEEQINHRKQNNCIPQQASYFVIADPPGCKIGSGGATLNVLHTLLETLGHGFLEQRVLLIHSGGQSQRLPSYSALGKIFCPLPLKNLKLNGTVSEMFDLKLALYWPLCSVLGAGVFVAGSDDIETYYLNYQEFKNESLHEADFVALAHPSSLKIGEGHGVYVLDAAEVKKCKTCKVINCLEVLQKPPQSLMRSKGAVLRGLDGEEFVYSDSAFWINSRVYASLLSWYTANLTLTKEVDAYAHFLPCLGQRMTSFTEESFNDLRAEFFPILKGMALKIILLNQSNFYHLGTMGEYLHNLTASDQLERELGLTKHLSNSSVVITDSHINESIITFGANIIIERSRVAVPLKISNNCILSNCLIDKIDSVHFNCDAITIFDHLLYYTVPIRHNGDILYLTISCEVFQNVKDVHNKLTEIMFLGTSVETIIKKFHYSVNSVVSNGQELCLWNMKLFMSSSSKEESFWRTHNFINKVLCLKKPYLCLETTLGNLQPMPLFSMADIIKYKDVPTWSHNAESIIS